MAFKVDWIVGSAILVYFATTITELISSVPVGLVVSNFKGSCILGAKVECERLVSESIIVTKFGSSHSCNFCTYLTIITILFPLVYGSYSLYALYKSIDNATQMWVFPALMVNALLLILKFCSSCVLSAGSSQFCSSVTKSSKDITSCKEGQKLDWYTFIGVVDPTEDPIALNGKHYHSYLTTAQSASWFCVLEWLLLVVLTFLHYRRNISLRSSTDSSQTALEFGGSTKTTTTTTSNQFLPGSSYANPNYGQNWK